MSTLWRTAASQKPRGALLAARSDRAPDMTDRIARSATPLRSCTCGGEVVCRTREESSNSLNSRDTNSPALSEWNPLMRRMDPSDGSEESFALKSAMKRRILAGASLFYLRKYTNLKRE